MKSILIILISLLGFMAHANEGFSHVVTNQKMLKAIHSEFIKYRNQDLIYIYGMRNNFEKIVDSGYLLKKIIFYPGLVQCRAEVVYETIEGNITNVLLTVYDEQVAKQLIKDLCKLPDILKGQ